MKPLSIFFIVVTFFATAALGVPARKEFVCHKQPDGTTVELMLEGDEYFHFHSTRDGFPVILTAEGGFCYADCNGVEIHSCKLLAHNAENRGHAEWNYLKDRGSLVRQGVFKAWKEARQRAVMVAGRPVFRILRDSISYMGQKRGLVILVNFQDQAMQSGNPAELKSMFTQKGYSGNNHLGSVSDYFASQSYGKFQLAFDVVGPVTISHNYGYYGSNSGMANNDKYPAQMVAEACQLVDSMVNFSDYDWDGDGEVEQVFIVYAGYGEATGGTGSTIWPHQSTLSNRKRAGDSDGALFMDGVTVDTYACSNELDGDWGTNMMGIGTACHEFSHCLGLPDLYDTDYSGAFGMSYFDLMNSGAHSGPKSRGERPYGYSAFERWYCGWLTFEEISVSGRFERLPDLQDSPKAYILCNDNNPDEFLVLENHQNRGWYEYVRNSTDCHGLMVTHIDYDSVAWKRNNVNPNLEHQRMSIIPADGDYGYQSSKGFYPSVADLEGDLFPGSKDVTALTNDTHTEVGSTLFTKNRDGSYKLNKAIADISEKEGFISFNVFFTKSIPIPVVLPPKDVTERGFVAIWEPVEEASDYTVELTEYVSERPIRIQVRSFDVKDTYLSFSDLQYDFYTFRVRANGNGISSLWSERIPVRLLANSISDIVSLNGKKDVIYTINGILGEQPHQNRLLIVREKSGLFKKIFVRD